MILNPAIIAILSSSILICLLILAAAVFGLRVLRHWDLASGSELQLALERSTYLVSTVLATAFVFQLASFILFISTAEDLHALFVGAMCAAGTLNVNPYGYPALLLKGTVFLLAGLWLVLNHADNQSPEYPLIRIKYGLLLAIVPFSLAETIMLWLYLLGLEADVITSCCGTLFSAGSQEVVAGINLSLFGLPVAATFFSVMGITLAAGLFLLVKGRGGVVYAAGSILALVVSMHAVITFVSPYVYQLPTHHCPFCLLQREYSYIGYLIFLPLLGGAVTGLGAGVLNLLQHHEKTGKIVPGLCRRLTILSLSGFLVFLLVVLFAIATSDLVAS